jgi:hypothetical protein
VEPDIVPKVVDHPNDIIAAMSSFISAEWFTTLAVM